MNAFDKLWKVKLKKQKKKKTTTQNHEKITFLLIQYCEKIPHLVIDDERNWIDGRKWWRRVVASVKNAKQREALRFWKLEKVPCKWTWLKMKLRGNWKENERRESEGKINKINKQMMENLLGKKERKKTRSGRGKYEGCIRWYDLVSLIIVFIITIANLHILNRNLVLEHIYLIKYKIVAFQKSYYY